MRSRSRSPAEVGRPAAGQRPASATRAPAARRWPGRWLAPAAAYLVLWFGFNLLRARADDTPWAEAVLGLVPRLEAWLFGGWLPPERLQTWLAARPPLAWWDYAWVAVYLSFFVAPYLAAGWLLWRSPRLFRRYLLATAVLFGLALVAFVALPTAPPWLATEAVPAADLPPMRRVTEAVLRRLDLPFQLFESAAGGRRGEVRFEPNPVAAMPSIHFAATALLVFPARRAGRAAAAAALLYAALMGVALAYLGEHYVLDLVAGGAMAAAGWLVAGRLLGAGGEPTAGRRRGADRTARRPPFPVRTWRVVARPGSRGVEGVQRGGRDGWNETGRRP